MSEPAIFAGSYLKLKRARQHISELHVLLCKAIEENPPYSKLTKAGIGTNGLPEACWEGYIPPATEMTPSIIGDVIHNMRSALGHMACELARFNSKSDKGVYFPFAEDLIGLEEMIRRKNFMRCGVDAVAFLRSFKPYKNGNVELRFIHDLDVMDKHR